MANSGRDVLCVALRTPNVVLPRAQLKKRAILMSIKSCVQNQFSRARSHRTAAGNCNSRNSGRLAPRESHGVAINAPRWWLESIAGRIFLRDKRRGNRVVARWQSKLGVAQAELLAMLARRLRLRAPRPCVSAIKTQLRALGIALDYGNARDLPITAEPARLVCAGIDRFRRTIWLAQDARSAWHKMHAAAIKAGVRLEIISAFRSQRYQADLLSRKRSRGELMTEILKVSAAPGYSEHHSGRAIDVAAPGMPPLTEAFADSGAFLWLQQNAHRYGFIMSFAPENRHGVMYEPWHWCYHPRNTRR